MRSHRLLAAALAVALSAPAALVRAQEPAPTPPPRPVPSPVPEEHPRARGTNDQRRTIKSYPANVGYNLIGVVTKGNWRPLAFGAALTASASMLDDEAVQYFQDHRYPWLADAGHTAGSGLVVAGLTLGFFSAGRIARGDRFRAATYDLSQAMLVNGAWTFALKATIRRERPHGGDRLSFPSGHASNAFASATVLSRHYGLKAAIPSYGIASLIAISRLARNSHHFSDVVAGAAFGYGVGRAVVRRNSRPPTLPGGPTPPTPKDPARVDLWPNAGPSGDGVGLALSIRF
jgi:membrane-associated phospholipid phosphatase